MLELALHVLDLLRNTVEAGATRVYLTVDENWVGDLLRVSVGDNGRGMDAHTVAHVLDPFYTSRQTRHVGLGLPLLAAAAERAGGAVCIESAPGVGTTVEATFRLGHPDCQPLGNMADTLLAFLSASAPPDLCYVHQVARAGEEPEYFAFDTAEMRVLLGDLPLNHPDVQRWLAAYLAEGERSIGQGVSATQWPAVAGTEES